MDGHSGLLKNLDDDNVNIVHAITRHDPLYKYPCMIYVLCDTMQHQLHQRLYVLGMGDSSQLSLLDSIREKNAWIV
jgi:hypothetical protein